jgi:hypothetical protein
MLFYNEVRGACYAIFIFARLRQSESRELIVHHLYSFIIVYKRSNVYNRMLSQRERRHLLRTPVVLPLFVELV